MFKRHRDDLLSQAHILRSSTHTPVVHPRLNSYSGRERSEPRPLRTSRTWTKYPEEGLDPSPFEVLTYARRRSGLEIGEDRIPRGPGTYLVGRRDTEREELT